MTAGTRALGGAGWDWNGCCPISSVRKAISAWAIRSMAPRGRLKVSDAHHPATEISRAFLLALQAVGVPYTADFNGGDERGAGFLQSTTYRGRRWSSAKAFMQPLLSDRRLTVKFRAQVLKVITKAIGPLASSMRKRENGRARSRPFASNEIVLCAGSFISPKILMLSGDRAGRRVATLGIEIKSDLPGVGQNMQDHNDASLFVETKENYGYSGEDRGLRMLRNGFAVCALRLWPGRHRPVPRSRHSSTLMISRRVRRYSSTAWERFTPSADRPKPPPGDDLIANLVAPKSRGEMRLRFSGPQ